MGGSPMSLVILTEGSKVILQHVCTWISIVSSSSIKNANYNNPDDSSLTKISTYNQADIIKWYSSPISCMSWNQNWEVYGTVFLTVLAQLCKIQSNHGW